MLEALQEGFANEFYSLTETLLGAGSYRLIVSGLNSAGQPVAHPFRPRRPLNIGGSSYAQRCACEASWWSISASRSVAMLNSVSHLKGSTITATDGAIGHVKEAYFDDQAWAIRYLVVDAGTWLEGRDVLIPPYSVKQPVGSVKNIDVYLTRKQVEACPAIATHLPVSRRHEQE